jgi:hypothetical protein
MSSLLSKLADHPNATSDPATNPSKGVTGAPAAVPDDNDPTRSSPANWVAKGQGGERKFGNDEYQAKAGSMSSPDTAVPAQETLPSPERMRELEASVRR